MAQNSPDLTDSSTGQHLLTEAQRARGHALIVARDVLAKRTFGGSEPNAGAGDLVYLAEFILDGGHVLDGGVEEVTLVSAEDAELASRRGYLWDDLRERIQAKPRAWADDILDALQESKRVKEKDGGTWYTSDAYYAVMDYLDRVAAPYVQAGIIAPESPEPAGHVPSVE